MDSRASAYKNVAILDSFVGEENIIDSEVVSTSAFDILMAYANRENLFPMNVNVEVDTNKSSDVMFEAEYVGMVDDIVRMLMGDGDIVAPEDAVEFIDQEVRQEDDGEKKTLTPTGGRKVSKEIPELGDTVIDFKPRNEGKSDELDDDDNSLDGYGDGTLQS